MKKTETPIVTCILITYNHGRTIAQAIDSILRQTTNFPLRILIQDDCSTDQTADICTEYKSRYPNLIDFTPSNKNIGIVDNVYSAISKVTTEFYSMLEGDDYWNNDNKLQKQIDALRANPDCSFCGHNTLQVGQDGTESLLFTPQTNNIREKYGFPQKRIKRDWIKVHPSSRVYRTAALRLNDLRFKDSVVWDSSAYWYFLEKGNLYYIDEPMSVYRADGNGAYTGSSKDRQRYMSILNTLNINEEFDFKYNRFFMKTLMKRKHRGLLKLSPLECTLLRLGFKKKFSDYDGVRKMVETQLRR